jgi:hypothetical protein
MPGTQTKPTGGRLDCLRKLISLCGTPIAPRSRGAPSHGQPPLDGTPKTCCTCPPVVSSYMQSVPSRCESPVATRRTLGSSMLPLTSRLTVNTDTSCPICNGRDALLEYATSGLSHALRGSMCIALRCRMGTCSLGKCCLYQAWRGHEHACAGCGLAATRQRVL